MKFKEESKIYNHIEKDIYLKYRDQLRKETRNFKFDKENQRLPQVTFEIIRLELNHLLDDYACFLAHYEKFQGKRNKLESIHIAENVIKNFNSFWDYLGFNLNLVYSLNIDFDDVYFKKVIGEINFISQGTPLRKLSIKLEKLYDKDKKIRDYRHKSIHRSKLAYFRNENENTDNILNNLKEKLKESYNRIIKALKIYFKMINECEPFIEIKVK